MIVTGETSRSDITALSLRGASVAIGNLTTFKVGQASVSRESLFKQGADLKDKALQEATALGALMINRSRSLRLPTFSKIKVAPVELGREPKFTDSWNTVLGTTPAFRSPTRDANGLEGIHSWRFRAYTYRFDSLITGRGPILIGLGIHGTLRSLSPDAAVQCENYIVPIDGNESDFSEDAAYQAAEEPHGLFYAAQLGLLRAARLELGDKSVPPVVE